MELPSKQERIKEAGRGLDALAEPAVLFDRTERIIHANEKARSLFNRPLLTRHDLPEQLTAGLDCVLAKGGQSTFCYQVTGGRLFHTRIRPLYFDDTHPRSAACALLRMEEKTGGCVSDLVATHLYFELANAFVPIATLDALLNDPSRDAKSLSDPEFQEFQRGALAALHMRGLRVVNILRSAGSKYSPSAGERVSLGSLMTKAYQSLKLYQGRSNSMIIPTQLVCKGPDDLAFSTGGSGRLQTIFTEVLLDLNHPSNSVTVQWAEDHHRLGVPTAKVEFAIASVKTAVGFGLCVAEEFVLHEHGCMEVTPGKPGTLSLWLPLTLP